MISYHSAPRYIELTKFISSRSSRLFPLVKLVLTPTKMRLRSAEEMHIIHL